MASFLKGNGKLFRPNAGPDFVNKGRDIYCMPICDFHVIQQ